MEAWGPTGLTIPALGPPGGAGSLGASLGGGGIQPWTIAPTRTKIIKNSSQRR
jgi:hypothetical protein